MIPRPGHLTLVLALLAAGSIAGVARAGDIESWTTPKDDAVIRRTDSCNCAPLLPGTGTPGQGQGLPDLVEVNISGWQPTSAEADMFTGSVVDHNSTSHFFRLRMIFNGVVNPPGTLGVGSGTSFDPFQFGVNPLYGFFEIDIDEDKDTGGEHPSVAALRFLGNAGRFGGRPYGAIGARAALSGEDLNQPWTQSPQLCRSGADWVVSFCGCFNTTVLWTSAPNDTVFSAGDTWLVQGRFFQRSGGYQQASAMLGGSAPGLYDPPVALKFAHNTATNETTITLVFPLTQTGAAQLSGGTAEPLDTSAANQASIQEGVQELINRAQNLSGLTGLTREIVKDWAGKSFNDVKDATEWRITALVGTSPCTPSDALYVWTDVGFGVERGDVDGDGSACNIDRALVLAYIAANDGDWSRDTDSIPGQVTVPNFGVSFVVYDVDGDGIVGPLDLAFFDPPAPPCIADFDKSGMVNIDDIFVFLNAWFAGQSHANVDNSGGVTIDDIFVFLNLWFSGCP